MSQDHDCAGVVLSPQELAWLQSPPSPFHVRGSFCTASTGLLGAYALTDVLMALSGMPLNVQQTCKATLVAHCWAQPGHTTKRLLILNKSLCSAQMQPRSQSQASSA